MDDAMAGLTGMAWQGVPFPPTHNEERYNALMEAFSAMPPTPDSRLQRDIWNRLNALNQKKLEGLEWKVQLNKKENAKAHRIRRRLQRQAELESGRGGAETESEPMGLSGDDGWNSSSYAHSEDDEHRSFRRWSRKLVQLLRKCHSFWRENIVPVMTPALIIVSWFAWTMTHVKNVVLHLPGHKGWPYKLGFLLP